MNIKAGKLSVVLLLIFSFSISLLFSGCIANFKKDSKNETKKKLLKQFIAIIVVSLPMKLQNTALNVVKKPSG